MGMLGWLFLPITGPFKGLMFVAERITEEAERVWYDEAGIRAALMEIEMRLEDGTITQAEFAQAENQLVERLMEAARRREAQAQLADRQAQ